MGKKVGKPKRWKDAVLYASLRIKGETIKDAAKYVGVTRITGMNWERSDFWPELVDEADEAYLFNIVAFARTNILAAVKEGDIDTSKWVLDRAHPKLARKAQMQKMEVEATGKNVSLKFEIPEPLDD